jgi:hypothetical protein
MRRFLEFKGQGFRLDYDRDRADFVIKTEPHPFLLNLQRAIGVGGSGGRSRQWSKSSSPIRRLGRRRGYWRLPTSVRLADEQDALAKQLDSRTSNNPDSSS